MIGYSEQGTGEGVARDESCEGERRLRGVLLLDGVLDLERAVEHWFERGLFLGSYLDQAEAWFTLSLLFTYLEFHFDLLEYLRNLTLLFLHVSELEQDLAEVVSSKHHFLEQKRTQRVDVTFLSQEVDL